MDEPKNPINDLCRSILDGSYFEGVSLEDLYGCGPLTQLTRVKERRPVDESHVIKFNGSSKYLDKKPEDFFLDFEYHTTREITKSFKIPDEYLDPDSNAMRLIRETIDAAHQRQLKLLNQQSADIRLSSANHRDVIIFDSWAPGLIEQSIGRVKREGVEPPKTEVVAMGTHRCGKSALQAAIMRDALERGETVAAVTPAGNVTMKIKEDDDNPVLDFIKKWRREMNVSVNSMRALPTTPEEYKAFEKVFENLQYASSTTVRLGGADTPNIPISDGTNCTYNGNAVAALPDPSDDLDLGSLPDFKQPTAGDDRISVGTMGSNGQLTKIGSISQADYVKSDAGLKAVPIEYVKTGFDFGKIYTKDRADAETPSGPLYTEATDDAILFPRQGDSWYRAFTGERGLTLQVTPRLVWFAVGNEGSTMAGYKVFVMNWNQFNAFMRYGGYGDNSYKTMSPRRYDGDPTKRDNLPRFELQSRDCDFNGVTLREVVEQGAEYIEYSKL